MLGAIAKTWSEVVGYRKRVDPESAPTQSQPDLDRSESVRHRYSAGCLEHHSTEEHAALLLRWIQDNIDLSGGLLLLHDAVREFYAEAIVEAGWAPKPWNPVAREFDLLCTGGRKPYEWVMSPTGRMQRLRRYPIPPSKDTELIQPAIVKWQTAKMAAVANGG